MTKNLIIFGTRPEAIKMAPLIKEFMLHADIFETKVCVTAQHREMLDQVLDFFEIFPDFDLNLMTPNQDLNELTSSILLGLKPVLESFRPDYVYVHGDTTTTMAASMAAFYYGSKICHVEAGLRTNNIQSPFPEEMNRTVTGIISNINFAPTNISKRNLILENKNKKDIVVTGNTVIDALFFSINKVLNTNYNNAEINKLKTLLDPKKKLILVTGHRRENHGLGLVRICNALKHIVKKTPNVEIVYPLHLNPNVQNPVKDRLSETENIHLIPPLSYPSFVWLMAKSYLIITDSGGVQEEAPSLGKPVLVMRDTTERPEAVTEGTVILVGTNTKKIISETNKLLNDTMAYEKMSKAHNPYGDGSACLKIVNYIISCI